MNSYLITVGCSSTDQVYIPSKDMEMPIFPIIPTTTLRATNPRNEVHSIRGC